MERLQTGAKAKKAQLERIRASMPGSGNHSTERQAANVDVATARKIRTKQRRDADRIGAKQRETQRAAENVRRALGVVQEKARNDAERLAQVEATALKEDQKTARDAKYAARKGRQK